MTNKIRAFNIRGLGHFPSAGMANLATELRAVDPVHIAASDDDHGVLGFEFVNNLTEANVTAHKSGRLLVDNGHSFGGNSVCMIAQNLYTDKFHHGSLIRIEYAAVIDPAMQSLCVAYPSIKYCYNPFQKSDMVGRGIVTPAPNWLSHRVIHAGKKAIDGSLLNFERDIVEYTYANNLIMTIENERRDMGHVTIDDDAYIHNKIVRAVKNLLGLDVS